jgi:CheY-like chemotaxis protein
MHKIPGEIILVDDEEYEEDFLNESLDKLEYVAIVKYFNSAESALEYIRRSNHEIFLIISDIHMHPMSGLELKRILDEDANLRLKAIPFVFATAMATQASINSAYELHIQGFFEKPTELNKLVELLSTIIRYWIVNLHPHKNEFRLKRT